MPDIMCTARDCAYNKNCSCCLGNINVGGANARSAEGTSCENFVKSHAVMQIDESPCHCTEIDCDACDCTYNCDGSCTAEKIDVCSCGCGEKDCNCSEDTECSTFKKSKH